MSDRPCSAHEAVLRAQKMLAMGGGQYWLGTGDYRPVDMNGSTIDVPWTTNNGGTGSDCCGFAITWCYKLRRHRPGFNVGSWSTCSDDINCDSALEDARQKQELFVEVTEPQPGDMLLWPTIWLPQHHPPFEMCGHVCIVLNADRWNPSRPRYADLMVAQSHGPNGFKPGVVQTDGSMFDYHNSQWSLPQHRCALIRAKP